jgi:hypothetical protein
VREAVNGDTVYAAFVRWTNQISNTPDGATYDSQVVVVKSVDAGADGFTALGANGNGVQVADPIVGFTSSGNNSLSLGQNRAGANSAIAVDPNDANHVVVAYSASPVAGVTQVVVQESTDGGTDWTQKFITDVLTRSGQAELAILNNGDIGLLYNNYDPNTNKLSVHLVTTTNDFATTTNTTLATQTNSIPVNQGQPYLGDYSELRSVGNTFYGVFSASNADNGTLANITNASFQRSFTGTPGTPSFQLTDANGHVVAPSIDPFFFTETMPTPVANLIGVAPHLHA